MRDDHDGRSILWVAAVTLLLVGGFWGAVIYIALHFIRKAW